MKLEQRIVAITGASSGIGHATALACARAGAAVALAARRAERIEALAERIEREGGRALAWPADVADEAQARGFIEATVARLGGLDALVNNAGVMLLGPVAEAPTEEWRRMIDVNLLGVLYCTRAALPVMLGRRSGHVVMVGSVAGRNAHANSAVYNLTKFGLHGFSEALRQEVTAQGVRVTVVGPGAVATELPAHTRDELREDLQRAFDELTPLEPDDVADAIVYALAAPPRVSLNELVIRPTTQVE